MGLSNILRRLNAGLLTGAVAAVIVIAAPSADASQENWFIFGKGGITAKQHASAPRSERQHLQRRGTPQINRLERTRTVSTRRGQQQQTRRASLRRQAAPVAVANQPYQPPAKYRRQLVDYSGSHKPGTIVIDTNERLLYHVQAGGKAMRYGVGVGRAGFNWSGTANIKRKAEWPSWRPPQAMIERERLKGRELPAFMPGGPENPLGARALYLYQGSRDTLYRIHGTNNPRSIGLAMSSGCIRMLNEDVQHLYSNTKMGTKVVVL